MDIKQGVVVDLDAREEEAVDLGVPEEEVEAVVAVVAVLRVVLVEDVDRVAVDVDRVAVVVVRVVDCHQLAKMKFQLPIGKQLLMKLKQQQNYKPCNGGNI